MFIIQYSVPNILREKLYINVNVIDGQLIDFIIFEMCIHKLADILLNKFNDSNDNNLIILFEEKDKLYWKE